MPLRGQKFPLGVQHGLFPAVQIFNDQIRPQGKPFFGQIKEIFAFCLRMNTILTGVKVLTQDCRHIALKHALHGEKKGQGSLPAGKGGKTLPLQKYTAQFQKALVVCHRTGLPAAQEVLLHMFGYRDLLHDG